MYMPQFVLLLKKQKKRNKKEVTEKDSVVHYGVLQ